MLDLCQLKMLKEFMSKFKPGDIITLIDDLNDEAVRKKIKGIYKITEVHPGGYAVYSYNLKEDRSYADLFEQLECAQADFAYIHTRGLAGEFPCHLGKYSTVRQWFDSSYRLATEAEIVLYVRKT